MNIDHGDSSCGTTAVGFSATAALSPEAAGFAAGAAAEGKVGGVAAGVLGGGA